jgi:hypothetical protein
MKTDLSTLFADFDDGRLSRRQLLTMLGLAVAVSPSAAFAQGQCGGARKGTPECDPTPAKLPFEPTGWKTVLLDHFSCQVVDYPKEAAFYAALMNWKIRSDDGKQAVLDIGDGAVSCCGADMCRRRRHPHRRLRLRPPLPARLVASAVAVRAAPRARLGMRRSTDSAGASSRGTQRKSKRS